MTALSVVVPTFGRPELIGSMMLLLQKQTRKPDCVIFSVTADGCQLPQSFVPCGDGERFEFDGIPVVVLVGEQGSSRQRNRAVEWLRASAKLTDSDVVVFFDDDFVPRADWLARAETILATDAATVGVTGILLADGAALAGYDETEAERIIADNRAELPSDDWRRQTGAVSEVYGCNMAVRGSCVARLPFDETLPLYGWLEDFDFSARLSRFGAMSRDAGMVGVHRGVKSGRVSGRKLGYSQIANPLYLADKNTMNRRAAVTMFSKNIAANLLKSVRPEPFIDRRGRLRGNLDALLDMVRGSLHPGRVDSAASK